jgi:hypothetical protein
MPERTPDAAALFAQLKEEVRASVPRRAAPNPEQTRLAREQAERLWPVSAERRVAGKASFVKRVLRRLMRWYVEPAFAEQRAFNDALLKLVDDLEERISRLERR